MPIFVFKHPSTGKIIEVVQKMTEPHYFTDEEGVTWTRIFTIPRASVDTKIDPNSAKEFVAKINSLKGFEDLKPNIAASVTYDGTKILLNAIEKVGTDDQKIRDELAKTKYNGISNPVIEFVNGDEIVANALNKI